MDYHATSNKVAPNRRPHDLDHLIDEVPYHDQLRSFTLDSPQLSTTKKHGRMTPLSIKEEAQQATEILAKEPGWPNARCILTLLLFILITVPVCLLIYLYGPTVAVKTQELVFNLFEYLHEFAEPYRTIVFCVASYTIQVLGVPIACVLITVIAYCYESYVYGFAVSMAVCVCTNVTLYFLFRKTEATYQPLHDLEVVEEPVSFAEFIGHLMKDFIETYPYRFGLMLRTLHLPDYAKMYILVKYRATFKQMMLPCLVVDSLNVLLYSFVGSQIKNRFEAMSSQAFSDKPLAMKIVTILAVVLVAFQIGVMIGGIIYTRRKYAEYENTGRLRVTPIISTKPSGIEKPVYLD
jgi:uncharacterized membrane protein YkgB